MSESTPIEGKWITGVSVPTKLEGTLTFDRPKCEFMCVAKNGKILGRLIEKDGKIHFEGDATEAAKEFFDSLRHLFQRAIDEAALKTQEVKS
jgi:hypothetical protein